MASVAKEAVDDAAVAWILLTRVPVPWRIARVDERMARACPWFPAVGAVVGLVGAAAFALGASLWGPVVGALLAAAATALATGAFHEDGLADTFDGLGGGPGCEQALAIMRDSRIGTFGALALGLVTALRVAGLAALGGQAPAALVGAHALARYSSLPLIRWLPDARSRAGAAAPFAGDIAPAGFWAATGFTLVLTAGLWGAVAVTAWVVAAAVILLLGAWLQRRLGGMTGDGLGATNQLVETAAYLVLAAIAI